MRGLASRVATACSRCHRLVADRHSGSVPATRRGWRLCARGGHRASTLRRSASSSSPHMIVARGARSGGSICDISGHARAAPSAAAASMMAGFAVAAAAVVFTVLPSFFSALTFHASCRSSVPTGLLPPRILSIEEQFYAIWPPAVRRPSCAAQSRARALVWVIVLAPMVALVCEFHWARPQPAAVVPYSRSAALLALADAMASPHRALGRLSSHCPIWVFFLRLGRAPAPPPGCSISTGHLGCGALGFVADAATLSCCWPNRAAARRWTRLLAWAPLRSLDNGLQHLPVAAVVLVPMASNPATGCGAPAVQRRRGAGLLGTRSIDRTQTAADKSD